MASQLSKISPAPYLRFSEIEYKNFGLKSSRESILAAFIRAGHFDVAAQLACAFGSSDTQVPEEIAQKVLHAIYSARTEMSDDAFELDSHIFAVRRTIEEKILLRELMLCENEVMPDNPVNFRLWFEEQIMSHPASRHTLYGYIAENCTMEDFRSFISCESTVDNRFDDLLSMLQLAFKGQAKMEMAHNYWDEMGEGNPRMVHTDLFRQVFCEAGFKPMQDSDIDLAAMRCGNLLTLLASYRAYSNYAIGAFGITEALAPFRFRQVIAGGQRLGLSEKALEYFHIHVQVDDDHTEGWLRNVIEPTLMRKPDLLSDICKGVIMRLNTSLNYCDALLKRLVAGNVDLGRVN